MKDFYCVGVNILKINSRGNKKVIAKKTPRNPTNIFF